MTQLFTSLSDEQAQPIAGGRLTTSYENVTYNDEPGKGKSNYTVTYDIVTKNPAGKTVKGKTEEGVTVTGPYGKVKDLIEG